MAMTRVRWALLVVALTALGLTLAYLRDPPWLATMTSGMGAWMTAPDGTRYRWAGSHSSLFVPSTATVVRIPMRATFDTPRDWPITAAISVDDRLADQVTLQDDEWRAVEFRMPPPGSRKHRRIDIRLDRTRRDGQGVQVGEIVTR
jgi:hypothetical protein